MTSLREPPKKPRTSPVPIPGMAAKSKNSSVQIGLVGTILVHVLILLIGPYLLRLEHGGVPVPLEQQSDPFEIELGPELSEEEQLQEPDPFKFVETNPDAPDNAPDSTDAFSDRNQQVAQEEESEDMSGDRPVLEGQTKIESERIVSGQLAPIIPPAPSAPEISEEDPTDAVEESTQAQLEQIPLSGFEDDASEESDGLGTKATQLAEGSAVVDEYVEGIKDAPIVDGPTSPTARINPNVPRPRPSLQKRARPAIFSQSNVGTSNIGPIGLDARWSSYGQYLQELIETVQIQWDRILIQSKVYPKSGSKVIVSFILDDEGNITRILGVDGSSNDLAKQNCVSAIADRAPYGEWTEDMKSVLGEEQQMTFTFYYQ